jgi:urease accessory protein
MPRATSVLGHGRPHDRPVVDTAILDYAQRSAGKVSVTTVKGAALDIDLHAPARLATDDCLVLEDGSLVEVVAAPEALIEARAANLEALARLAWHLGDRHVPVQVLPNRVRVKRDPAIESLLTLLGAKVALIEAPFEPEGGAYESHAHDHDHDHDHGHHGHHHDH